MDEKSTDDGINTPTEKTINRASESQVPSIEERLSALEKCLTTLIKAQEAMKKEIINAQEAMTKELKGLNDEKLKALKGEMRKMQRDNRRREMQEQAMSFRGIGDALWALVPERTPSQHSFQEGEYDWASRFDR